MSESEEPAELKRFSPEWLASRSTLEIEAHLDTTPVLEKLKAASVLEKLNQKMGTSMQLRQDGFHITVIAPHEYGSIKDFGESDIEELKKISEDMQKGDGISASGVGYIDGATAPGMREVDKVKKTSFIAFDIPALNAFREKHGLPKTDFHVTLGFEVKDIHMQVVGSEPGPKGKMKDVVEQIAKKANPAFAGLLDSVELTFGGIDGEEKQKAAEKPKPVEKAPEVLKEYSESELRENLGIYEAEVKIPVGSVNEIAGLILSRDPGAIKELGKKYGKYMSSIRAAMIASPKKG